MKTIIELLEREGGHIVTLALLFIACTTLSLTFPDNALLTKGGDLTLGALLLAMKGSGNKSNQDETKTDTTK